MAMKNVPESTPKLAAELRMKTNQLRVAPRKFVMPKSPYLPASGNDVRGRLATLQAALAEADELIEEAYDAAGPGEPIEILLHLINRTLLADAVHPMLADAPTAIDAAFTNDAMFAPLAAVQGAVALAVGTVLHQTLVDAFHLLDWAQTECDSLAVCGLLPGGQREVAAKEQPHV